jgi:Uma2 family endonuclease
VLVETGFVLERGPDTVRSPDVSLRLAPGPLSKAFVEGPPDLAVEIVSPSDRLAAIRRKAEAYLEAGMRGVWVVDPRRRQLWVYAPECEPHVLGPNDMLDGGLLLPGFDVRVGVLFE